MSIEPSSQSLPKPLRLWPGVALAVLVVLFKLVMPWIGVAGPPIAFLGGAAGALLIVLWWLFFSRAPWIERIAAFVLMIVALAATMPFLHESIATAGQGRLYPILALPVLAVALVAWAVVTRRSAQRARRVSMAAVILLAGASFALLKTGGITGDGDSDLQLRWTQTAEEKLLAQEPFDSRGSAALAQGKTPAAVADGKATGAALTTRSETTAKDTAATAAKDDPGAAKPSGPALSERGEATRVEGRVEWPGFRGPNRDNVIAGVRINTDWSAAPPKEIWRRPVGPGWSSFAVSGDYIYTQEQRGDDEVVSCYRLSTGEPVWRHRDPARFYESNGGPGPRATPALHHGRVYTHGATGIVNALDAATGARVWTRNAQADTGAEPPGWGFAGSPLIVDDVVVIAVSGALIGYDAKTGNPRWVGPKDGAGYSSPHLAVLDGVPQILLLRGRRSTSVSPIDGKVLWEHAWQPGASIVQPAVVGGRDVIVNNADAMGGNGTRRLEVTRAGGGWKVEERWTSRGLKPYFNDFVVHEGHAYGFDGNILACIDLNTGERKWKGGRYGNGQMLVLRDQDVLLVLAEEGDLALVKASPDQYSEIVRIPALRGKTWNHPVIVGRTLLVRNGEEMAAFELTQAR